MSSWRAVRVLAVAAAAVGLATIVAVWLWHAQKTNWFVSYLARRTGHRVEAADVSIDGRSIVARDVQLYGAPPFDGEPALRIERLEVQFGGGNVGRWTPSEIIADGVDVEYLSAGGTDNLRGARRSGIGASEKRRAWPTFRVRRGRLRGLHQVGDGTRIAFRARNFSVDAPSGGAGSATLEGVAIDVAQGLTALLPELRLDTDADAVSIAAQGEHAAVLVPGGGTLVDEMTVRGAWSGRGAELSLVRQAGPGSASAPVFRLSLRADGLGAQLSVDGDALPLRALRPLAEPLGLQPDGARGAVHLLASMETGQREIPFELDLRVRGLEAHHPALDSVPWRGLLIEAHAAGMLDAFGARLKVNNGELDLLGLKLAFRGWIELGSSPRGAWTVRTSQSRPADCAALWDAQPAPVRHALAGLMLGGSLGVSTALTFDAASWDALSIDLGVGPLCEVRAEPSALANMLPTLLSDLSRPAAAQGPPLGRYHPEFAPLSKMPQHLVAAFLTAEDGRFFNHRGFDKEMIRRALAYDLERHAFAKGGSTISQQLAKNLFLEGSRTLARKLEESVFAWRLESLLPKKRILELYLNVIELGPGIRGVKQAARAYFGKELSELRPIESAHLAALTPNPQGYARRFRDGRVDEGWLQRLYDLLGMMQRSGRLSPADLTSAHAGKLTLRKI